MRRPLKGPRFGAWAASGSRADHSDGNDQRKTMFPREVQSSGDFHFQNFSTRIDAQTPADRSRPCQA
jgi:hypothetical protein